MIDNLKRNIKTLLKHQNLSAYSLEKKAGLRPSAIQNILQGRSKNPGIDAVVAIATELGCTVEDLIRNKEPVQTISETFDLALLDGIISILIPELQKTHREISLQSFIGLLKDVYLYTQKMPNQEINKAFIEWLVERLGT